VLWIALVLAVIVASVVLVNRWANTPHGRIKPVFAVAFRLQGLRGESAGALVRPMGTPAEREAARAGFLREVAPLAKPVPFPGRIEDRHLDGPGGPLPVRIYTPPGAGPFPLLVYLHGGGFILGSPDYTEHATRSIALRAPAVVVSVDYRLAPEAPWPAAVEDAECALAWAVEHAGELGARPGPVAVGGDSAGGNLTAVLAQRDRDGAQGRIGLQVLVYPAVDASDLDRESYHAFATGYGLTRQDVAECFAHYVQGRTEATDPAVSPLHADSLEGLAPALVFTAGFDVLRDEGTEYAQRLAKAGVPVDHVREPAVPHGYLTMSRLCREAVETQERIAGAVRGLGTA